MNFQSKSPNTLAQSQSSQFFFYQPQKKSDFYFEPEINVTIQSPLKSFSKDPPISQNLNLYKQFYHNLINDHEIADSHRYCIKCSLKNIKLLDIPFWSAILVQHHRHSLQTNSIDLNYVFTPKIHYQIQFSTLHSKIIIFRVNLSYFTFHLQIINIQDQFLSFSHQFQKIQEGSYGIIYGMKDQLTNKFFAFKKINILNLINPVTLEKTYKAESCLRQFCVYKLMSAFGMGLKVPSFFGFDIVCFQDAMIFPIQYAKNLDDLPLSDLKTIEQNMNQSLSEQLFFLHSLRIIHNDLKPNNFMWSPSLKKLVLIDFGLSQVCNEKLGFKTLTTFVGTYAFCTEEMKQLYTTRGLKYIDMYWNDTLTLIKSTQQKRKQLNFVVKYERLQQKKENQENQNKIESNVKSFEKSTYHISKMVKSVYAIYKGNKEKFDVIIKKLEIKEITQHFLRQMAGFVKEITPNFKLFQIFNESIKPLLKHLPQLIDPYFLQLSKVYQTLGNVSEVGFVYDRELQLKNRKRYEIHEKELNITNLRTHQMLVRRINEGPKDDNMLEYDMCFISWLEMINFYEEEENYLKNEQIRKVVMKFSQIRFQENEPKNVFDELKDILQTIYQQIEEYLIDYHYEDYFLSTPNYKSKADLRSYLIQNRKYQKLFSRSEQQELQKYSQFQLRKKNSQYTIYPLKVITQSMPQILYRISRIDSRLENIQFLLIDMVCSCFFQKNIEKIITIYYQIFILYIQSDLTQIDFISLIDDLILFIGCKVKAIENQDKIFKKVKNLHSFQNYQQKRKKEKQEPKFKSFSDLLNSKTNNCSQKDIIEYFWSKMQQKLERYIQFQKNLKSQILNHQNSHDKKSQYKGKINLLIHLVEKLPKQQALILKVILIVIAFIYFEQKYMLIETNLNSKGKKHQQKLAIKFFVKYLSNNECIISTHLKEIMLIDLKIILVFYENYGQINDLILFSDSQNHYKTINIDIYKQIYYFKVGYELAYDDQLTLKFAAKVKKQNVFGSETVRCQTIRLNSAEKMFQNPDKIQQGQSAICKQIDNFLRQFCPNLINKWCKSIDSQKLYKQVIKKKYEFYKLNFSENQSFPIYNWTYSSIASKMSKFRGYFTYLKSFYLIDFYYNLLKYLLKELNKDMNNLLSQKQIIFILHYQEQDHLNSIINELNTVKNLKWYKKTEQMEKIANKQFSQKELEQMLVQKIDKIDANLNQNEALQYPCYYWLAKSVLIKYRFNNAYQVLYLDQFLMKEFYSKSKSKTISESIDINRILSKGQDKQSSSFGQKSNYNRIEIKGNKQRLNNEDSITKTPEQFWVQSPQAAQKWFNIGIYQIWLQTLLSQSNNSFGNKMFETSTEKFFSFDSLDTYYRFKSFHTYLLKNQLENQLIKPEMSDIHRSTLFCFLLHSDFSLLSHRLKYFIHLIDSFKLQISIQSIISLLTLLSSFLGPLLKTTHKENFSLSKKQKNIFKFFFFLLHQKCKNLHTCQFIKRKNIKDLLSLTKSESQLSEQFRKSQIEKSLTSTDYKCHNWSQNIEQIVFLMYLSLKSIGYLPRQTPQQQISRKFFLYELNILKRKSSKMNSFMRNSGGIEYCKEIRVGGLDGNEEYELLSHGKYGEIIEQMCNFYKGRFQQKVEQTKDEKDKMEMRKDGKSMNKKKRKFGNERRVEEIKKRCNRKLRNGEDGGKQENEKRLDKKMRKKYLNMKGKD